MTLRPVEWEVRLPLSGEAVAIVRAVQLGPHGDVYLRAVTPDADRSQRELLGCWASPQEAATPWLPGRDSTLQVASVQTTSRFELSRRTVSACRESCRPYFSA